VEGGSDPAISADIPPSPLKRELARVKPRLDLPQGEAHDVADSRRHSEAGVAPNLLHKRHFFPRQLHRNNAINTINIYLNKLRH
jgi:hypothetical protein